MPSSSRRPTSAGLRWGVRATRTQRRGGDRHPRLVLQLTAVEVVDRPQPTEVERAVDHVQLVGTELELSHEQLADLVGHIRRDLEADGLAEAAAAQLHLHGGE